MKKINFGIIFYSFSQIELSQFVTISFLLKKLIRVVRKYSKKATKARARKSSKRCLEQIVVTDKRIFCYFFDLIAFVRKANDRKLWCVKKTFLFG